MQQQEVEVSFCDLCGTSVPAGDLEAGKAVNHQGKTVGMCCLSALRGESAGASPAGGVGPAAGQPGQHGARAGADGGRLLTVGIVLLAAMAATVIFLDGRLSTLEKSMSGAQDQAVNAQRSNSDLLMGLDVKLDGAARRADLDAAVAKSGEVLAAIEGLQTGHAEQLDALRKELEVVRRDLAAMGAGVVDYRPLFEDLRQRHQRAQAAIEAMRVLAAQPVAVVPGPDPARPIAVKPITDLPAELVGHVQKLRAADPAVRFEAVDLLVESKNAKALPHLLPLAKDPDAFVRRLTVEGLREFPKPEAVETLLAALGDEDENVRDTAWRSLRDVSGQKFPFEASASKESRKRATQRWLDWWENAKATFGS